MNKLSKITKTAVIATLYVLLTYVSASFGLAYLPVQLRASESLCVLPVFMPEAVFGLTLGCFVSNLTSPFGVIDVLFGTLATCLSAVFSRIFKDVTLKKMPLLSLSFPVLINALIIGAEISFFNTGGFTFRTFVPVCVSIMISEFLACYGLGLALFFVLKRGKFFERFVALNYKQ